MNEHLCEIMVFLIHSMEKLDDKSKKAEKSGKSLAYIFNSSVNCVCIYGIIAIAKTRNLILKYNKMLKGKKQSYK